MDGRKNAKTNEKKVETYQMRLDRLKDELNRPVITSEYLKRSRLNGHIPTTHKKLKEEKLKDPDSMNETTKDWIVNDMPPAEEHIPDDHTEQDKLTKKQITLDTILDEITTRMPLIDENGSESDRYAIF